MITPDERAAWRAEHIEAVGFGGICARDGYIQPCPTVRLLDALDAAEAELAKERAPIPPAELNELLNEGMRRCDMRVRDLQAENDALRAQRDAFITSEHTLSESYRRMRKKLQAYDTPFAPTQDEITSHTEACLERLLAESKALRAQLGEVRQWADPDLCPSAIQHDWAERLDRILRISSTAPAPPRPRLDPARVAPDVAQLLNNRGWWLGEVSISQLEAALREVLDGE